MPITAGQIAFGIDADHIETKTLTQAQAYLFASGAIDGGALTSFEIPNSAAPTVNADGEVAIDITLADFSHGILKYFGGEEMGVVAMPIAEFTAPTNGHLVAYNSTTDEFELVAPTGGVDGSGSAGVLAGWADSDTLEAVAGLTSPSGVALRIEGQASGDVGLIVRGNTSDDDNILELRRGSNDAANVSWNMYGDMTVVDRFITLQSSGETRGGWHSSQGGWMIVPGQAYCFTNANNFNTIDARLERIGVSIVGLRDGAGTGGAAFSLVEQTAPSAPAGNGCYIYAEDNGSGKTRLMALFSSGAAQQIAIQP